MNKGGLRLEGDAARRGLRPLLHQDPLAPHLQLDPRIPHPAVIRPHHGEVQSLRPDSGRRSRLLRDGARRRVLPQRGNAQRSPGAGVGTAPARRLGVGVDPAANLWKYFNGKLDKRVRLVFRNPGTQKTNEVAVKPISASAENALLRAMTCADHDPAQAGQHLQDLTQAPAIEGLLATTRVLASALRDSGRELRVEA